MTDRPARVVAQGTFDLLHPGHLHYLREAREYGDEVHVIIGAPYGRDDWTAFDTEGNPRELEVLDVDMPEEEFFDFTQADIDAELDYDLR